MEQGMRSQISRRRFISSLGVTAATLSLPSISLGRLFEPPLYPRMDLSVFDTPITPAPSKIEFGCAAITWGGDDLQAIKDISSVGYHGIQLRANVLERFGDRPKELREILRRNHLEMVALSSGNVGIASGSEGETINLHTKHAQFVRDVGGHYLQLIDSARPKDRPPSAEDFKRLGHMLNEVSKRAVDLGVRVGYHNHMGSLGEAPEEVDRILEATDPRYLKFELDIAHYFQGGGNPVDAIKKYRDRLLFLHLKDVESLEGRENDRRRYRFVELGRGKIDLPGVMKALEEIGFRGWAIVELDGVPDKARTPKESAEISKMYLEEILKTKI